MIKNVQAVIFDMDGTLVDSLWVWNKIDREYLTNLNLTVPKNLKDTIEHMTFSETANYFKTTFNLKDNIEKIMDDWNNMAYDEYCNNVFLKPAAKNFLKLLKSKGIKIGLATSNCSMLLEATLKNNEIYDYFDCITTSDEVSKGKNFPDIYLLSAKKLGVNPENCIVFEDILPAIKGAKKAGMKVVGVHDVYSENQTDLIIKEADYYINSYEELCDII